MDVLDPGALTQVLPPHRRYSCAMRPLRFSINVTLDGRCDHRVIVGDEDIHRHAVENLAQADALLLGRYLENKGKVRAREASRHLSTIGARRTARWLTAALAPTADPSRLEKLDRQFFARPEDLASPVMAYIQRS